MTAARRQAKPLRPPNLHARNIVRAEARRKRPPTALSPALEPRALPLPEPIEAPEANTTRVRATTLRTPNGPSAKGAPTNAFRAARRAPTRNPAVNPKVPPNPVASTKGPPSRAARMSRVGKPSRSNRHDPRRSRANLPSQAPPRAPRALPRVRLLLQALLRSARRLLCSRSRMPPWRPARRLRSHAAHLRLARRVSRPAIGASGRPPIDLLRPPNRRPRPRSPRAPPRRLWLLYRRRRSRTPSTASRGRAPLRWRRRSLGSSGWCPRPSRS